MTSPAESDDESTRSAYWQGVMGTKLDTVIEEVRRMNDSKEADHARLEARIVTEAARLDARIDGTNERTDSLESWRDRSAGFIIGVGLGGGIAGGGVVSVINYLVT